METCHFDEDYFVWLYSQISSIKLKNPSRTYWHLARKMHETEFVWWIPNDDNRLEDGKYLRVEFMETIEGSRPDDIWMEIGCSMLEMLIALSRRLSFEADGKPSLWFWHMMANVDLRRFTDSHYDDVADKEVEQTLNRIIWRQYEASGNGGLFPLRSPEVDQRSVEIWYQLSAYLSEQLG